MPLHILTIVTVPLCLLLVWLVQKFCDPLKRIPGPFLARFTRLWLARHVWQGNFHSVSVDLHRKYGKIVRIRPNEYSIDDPSVIKVLYGAGSKFTKGDWYWAAASVPFAHLNLFTLQNPKQHSDLRKKQSSFYSMSSLHKYEPFVKSNTIRLCNQLKAFCKAGKAINLLHWLQCYAFDVITEMTFGQPFGFLDKGGDIDNLMALAENLQKYSSFTGLFPTVHTFISGFLKYDPAATIATYAVRSIKEHLSQGQKTSVEGPADFLTLFMEQHDKDPERNSIEIGISMLSSNLAAGSDTTGISLSAVFFYLLQEPRCIEKLLTAIDNKYPDKKSDDFFTFKEAQDLPYLQAIIKEALRLHPAGGMPLARRVPNGGATIARIHFPEGSVVGVNAWVAHRNPDVFGSDVDRFRPERWLEAHSESLSTMERYFLPFGSGSRTCIGKNISLLEMSKLIPYVLRNFDFTVQEPHQWFKSSTCDWFVKPQFLMALIKEKKI